MNDNKNLKDKEIEKKEKHYNSHFPKPKFSFWQNVMLACGMLLVLVGIFLLAKFLSDSAKTFHIRSFIFATVAVILLFSAFAFTESGISVYLGIFCFLSSIVFLLMDNNIVHLGLSELWPCFVISAGLAILPASIYKFKRIRSVYLFPSILLLVLGIFFLMFSLDVFKFTLVQFISSWWPMILIICGIALVVIFFVQKSNKKDFPYLEDDSLVHEE